VISPQKYEERRASFQLHRPLLVATDQRISYREVKLWNVAFFQRAASTSANVFVVSIFMCSTCDICRVTIGLAIDLSMPVRGIVKDNATNATSVAIFRS
jgi:hypothetical protein